MRGRRLRGIRTLVLCSLIGSGAGSAAADEGQSASYRLKTSAISASGGSGASSSYAVTWATIGEVAGDIGVGPTGRVFGGFPAQLQRFRAAPPDVTPPVIGPLSPPDGGAVSPLVSSLRLEADYADEPGGSGIDPASIHLTWDGGEVTPLATVTASRITYVPPPDVVPLPDFLLDGSHTASLAVADRAGNQAQVSWQFIIDRAAPSLFSPQPAPESCFDLRRPLIEAHYADGSNVPPVPASGIDPDTVVLTVNGVVVTGLATVSATTVSYTPPADLPEQGHTVLVSVADRAGNVREISWRFDVDLTPPILYFTVPVDGQFVNQTPLDVSGFVQDACLSAVLVDHASALTARVEPPNFMAQVVLAPGPNTLTARALDRAGHERSHSITVTLDTTPPTSVVVTDDGVDTSSTTSLHATWTPAGDPESGISDYQYQIRQDSPTGPLIRDWTSVGVATEVTATGFNLTVGNSYYLGIRAINGSGVAGTAAYSDGILLVCSTGPAVGGLISANTIWPSACGPYTVTSTVTVSNNATLTIEPGSVIRFNADTGLVIGSGTPGILIAQGTPTQPITFTSNSATPAPGQWNGLDFASTGASSVEHAIIEYGGAGVNNANVRIGSSSPTIRNSTIRFSDGHGIVAQADASPVLTGNAITTNGGRGLDLPTANATVTNNTITNHPTEWGMALHPNAVFSGNTLSGNKYNDAIVFYPNTAVTANRTWPAGQGSSTYVWSGSIGVNDGVTLTIHPGVTLKFIDATSFLYIDGTLGADGTPEAPITLTSFKDDAVGGDTNADGAASSPAPGDWRNLFFNAADSGTVLDYVTIRYAGGGEMNIGSLDLRNSSFPITNCTITSGAGHGIHELPITYFYDSTTVTIQDCTISSHAGHGIFIEYNSSNPTLTDNQLLNNAGYGLYLPAIATFSGNTLSGNNYANAIRLRGGEFTQHRTWSPQGGGGAYILENNVYVNPGGSLTLSPGLVLKHLSDSNSYLYVYYGTLIAQGTAAQPIVFTSIKDDAAAGDTNTDGNATTPAPGDWHSVHLYRADAVLDYCVFRYGGMGTSGLLSSYASSPVITNSEFSNSSWHGIVVDQFPAPQVRFSNFFNIASVAIQNSPYGYADVDARYNWWGARSGPSGSGPGTGVPVSGHVLFDPWLGDQVVDAFRVLHPNISPVQFSQQGGSTNFFTSLSQAGNWTIQVRDSMATLVKSFAGAGTTISQDWAGDDAASSPLPNGAYAFDLNALDAATGTRTASILGRLQLQSSLGVADITSPESGTLLGKGNSLTITGTASSPNFSSYRLEYGSGFAPTSWTTFFTSTTPVTNGVLGLLNPVPGAATVKTLTLRLTVTKTDTDQTIDTVPTDVFSTYNEAISPRSFSPNQDGLQDTTTISALINMPNAWALELLDTTLNPVRTFTSSSQAVTEVWDGKDNAQVLQADGPYTCRLTSTEASAGVEIVETFGGPIQLDTTLPVPVMSAPTQDQTVYHTVSVIGSTGDETETASYTLEVGAGDPPNAWMLVTSANAEVTNGELGQWVTKSFVPEEPDLPPLKEEGLANGIYTLRLTVNDKAGNTGSTTRRVDLANLYLNSVTVTPRIFDPTTGQVGTINYQTTLDSLVTVQLFSRDIAAGTPTLVASPLNAQLKTAGTHATTWNGRNDSGTLLPFTYYTFKLSAVTPTGERTAIYDRFFKYGVYEWPHYTQWMIPISTSVAGAPAGFTIGYTVPVFSRVEVEVGVPCTEAVIGRPEVDTPKLAGPQQLFWDSLDATGQLPGDFCPGGYYGDMSIGAKSYPLPENSLATASEPLQISGVSTEPAAMKPGANEITTITYTLNKDVDTLTLAIKDPNGSHFRGLSGLPMTMGSHAVEWDGRNDQGRLATVHGDYAFEMDATRLQGGAVLEATRMGHIISVGDYRIDAQGRRLNKRLQLIDVVEQAAQRLLGLKAQEINP